jgi:hypothetical protein
MLSKINFNSFKHNKKLEINMKTTFSLPFLCLIIFSLSLFGCFTAEDDSSTATSSPTPSTNSGPTTTIAVTDNGGSCPQSGGKYNCSGGSGSININFSASETATIYYNSNIGSTPTVSTNSNSVDSSNDVDFSGSDRDNLYVKYFAKGSSGTESQKIAIIYFVDIHTPTSSISSAILQDNTSNSCSYNNSTYYCDSKATVTLIADEPATIWYRIGSGADPGAPTGAEFTCTYTASSNNCIISVEAHDTYISVLARDTALTPNQETYHPYDFQISNTNIYDIKCGSTDMAGGGYCNDQVTFHLKKSDDALTDGSSYQLWYRKIFGTAVASDTSGDNVFDATGDPNLNSTRYLSTYSESIETNPEEIAADVSTVTGGNDKTVIYQYKYAIIYGGSYNFSTTGVTDGTSDASSYSVFYVDIDKPNITVTPPSSGTMNSSMKIIPFVQDPGHDKIANYAASNSSLSGSTPLQNTTAKYCQFIETSDDLYSAGFWQDCTNNRNSYTDDSQLIVASNSYLGFYGTDAAGNQSECTVSNQYTCLTASEKSGDSTDILEYYTPGIHTTSVVHPNNEDDTQYTNFGHSVLSADLDGDGYSNDIIISAPAYSYTDGTAAASTNVDQGAVYIWYDDFRERAQIRLGLGDATMDVSGSKTLAFTTDGGSSMSVTLDPSNDTLGLALSSDYQDKTAATAYEIAKVLNRAFLNSYGSGGNHLFAMATDATGDLLSSTFDASTDASTYGYVTIGHINRTISGYFTMASTDNFDASSDFNFTSKTVRAYDYAFFGEADNDEFGYAMAVQTVDTSSDSAYSAKNLIVGAPGYNGNTGAVYILKVPASDASADYGQVLLNGNLDNKAHRIHATSEGRFGMAMALYDKSSDGYEDLFVSAPYVDTSASNGGAIYQINARDYNFETTTDTTSDLNDASADSYAGSETNKLLGYSLVIGQAGIYNGSDEYRLYVGAPGTKVGGGKGKVNIFRLDSGTFTDNFVLYDTELNEVSGNLYGSSLAIVDSNFDTNGGCPCLLIGSPGSKNDTSEATGKVWIRGRSLETFIQGSADNEQIGFKLFVGSIDDSATVQSIFITSKNDGSTLAAKGKITILRQQAITNTNTTAGMSPAVTLEGVNDGDNFGFGLGIVQYNSTGNKALITGIPGEHENSSTYYRNGNVNNMRGSVQIISATKLGF